MFRSRYLLFFVGRKVILANLFLFRPRCSIFFGRSDSVFAHSTFASGEAPTAKWLDGWFYHQLLTDVFLINLTNNSFTALSINSFRNFAEIFACAKYLQWSMTNAARGQASFLC